MEHQLQHRIFIWFGQTWPEYRKMFFKVKNEARGQKAAQFEKSTGMVSGVSDMLLLVNGKAGIELKNPGSCHSKKHVDRQISWGKDLVNNGGNFIISSNEEVIKAFITDIINGKNPTPYIQEPVKITQTKYYY